MISIWSHLGCFIGDYNDGNTVRYYFDKNNRVFLSLDDIENFHIDLSKHNYIVPVINLNERDIIIGFLKMNKLEALIYEYNGLATLEDFYTLLNIKNVLISGRDLHDEYSEYKDNYIQESISNWVFDNRVEDFVVGHQPFIVKELYDMSEQYSFGWGLRKPLLLLECMLRKRIEHLSEEELCRRNRYKNQSW